MIVLIGLIASQSSLTDFFGRKKDLVVPPEIHQRGIYSQGETKFFACSVEVEAADPIAVSDFLLTKADEICADACLVICETTMARLIEPLKGSIFPAFFELGDIQSSILNFLRSILARALKSFSYVAQREEYVLLRLPFRNFIADDLADLKELCWLHTQETNFSNLLDDKVAKLAKRKRPRRRSNSATRYIVDDFKKFFDYGHENHSRFATASPHTSVCAFAGKFRFGVRVDELRHYNVSEGEGDRTTISGWFPDCHGASIRHPEQTHLNMFCNDYA